METIEKLAIRLMAYRMVVALTFFLSALGIQATIGGEWTLRPYYYLIALVLAFNLIYLLAFLLLRDFRGTAAFLYAQLGGDVISVTLLSFLTGGFESVFTFLYHILVLVAGFLLRRRGAFTIATLNCIAFGLLCVGLFYKWIDPGKYSGIPWDPPSAPDTLYALLAHYLGFFLIAALVSIMSGRLESTRATLGLVQRDLSSLRHLNDQIVSSLAAGLVATDRFGLVTFANEAALKLLGEGCQTGWSFPLCLKRLAAHGAVEPELLARTGEEVTLEFSEDRHILLLLMPLLERSEQVGTLAFLRDQTEMVRLKRQLELKEKMAATGEMAANIAHEIRNPLGSISGAAQMLRRTAPEESAEAALLDIVHNESRRLSEILDGFLRFSNPPPLSRRLTDFRNLVEEVVSLFSLDPAKAGGLVLTTDLPPEAPAVEIDPDQVRQSLWNLLLNARKAIAEQGVIRVGLRYEPSEVILEVEDDGVGMEPHHIGDYLQPFRKGFPKGTGLGLSVVYRVMEQHGGRLEILSTPGGGTCSRLHFPRKTDG